MLLQIAAKSEKRMPRESQGCRATQRFRRCGRRRLLGRRAEPRGAPEFGSLRRFTLAPGFALGAAIVYFIASVPDPVIAALDDRPPNVTILAQDGTVLAERGLRRGHVRLNSLPPYLVQAVLATEDRRFFEHLGVDPIGFLRAVFTNLRAGRSSRAARPSPSSWPRTCSSPRAHLSASSRS